MMINNEKNLLKQIISIVLAVLIFRSAAFGACFSARDAMAAEDYHTWRQNDARWSDVPMDNTTLGREGCLITAVAITVRASDSLDAEALKNLGISTIDNFNPGVLAQAYDSHDGFLPGGIAKWGTIHELVPQMTFEGDFQLKGNSTDEKLSEIQQLMSGGSHIILNAGWHWVYVEGIVGNEIYIIDPGSDETIFSKKYSLDDTVEYWSLRGKNPPASFTLPTQTTTITTKKPEVTTTTVKPTTTTTKKPEVTTTTAKPTTTTTKKPEVTTTTVKPTTTTTKKSEVTTTTVKPTTTTTKKSEVTTTTVKSTTTTTKKSEVITTTVKPTTTTTKKPEVTTTTVKPTTTTTKKSEVTTTTAKSTTTTTKKPEVTTTTVKPTTTTTKKTEVTTTTVKPTVTTTKETGQTTTTTSQICPLLTTTTTIPATNAEYYNPGTSYIVIYEEPDNNSLPIKNVEHNEIVYVEDFKDGYGLVDLGNDQKGWIELDGMEILPVQPERKQGDLNNDGRIDILDVNLLGKYLKRITDLPGGISFLSRDQLKAADLNNDGRITRADYLICLMRSCR